MSAEDTPATEASKYEKDKAAGLICGYRGCKAYKADCLKHKERHKARNDQFSVHYLRSDRNPVSREKMTFYKRHFGPKLRALVEAAEQDSKARGLHDISEEIALTKATLSHSIQFYNGVNELTADQVKSEDDRQRLLAESGAVVRGGLDHVTKLIERSAKIFALTAEKMDATAIDSITRQIMAFVFRCFDAYERHKEPGWEEFDDAMEAYLQGKLLEFNRLMDEELQLPSLKNIGTNMTPDQTALLMDATIPYTEE